MNAPSPPERGRMSDADFEEAANILHDACPNGAEEPLVAEARRAREAEKQEPCIHHGKPVRYGYCDDCIAGFFRKDAEIAALRASLDTLSAEVLEERERKDRAEAEAAALRDALHYIHTETLLDKPNLAAIKDRAAAALGLPPYDAALKEPAP